MINDLNTIYHTIQLSNHNLSNSCSECKKILRNHEKFDENINHYLQEHNFKLLYIGSQSDRDYEYNLVTNTIAILGREKG